MSNHRVDATKNLKLINSKDLGRIACARCRRLKIKCTFDSDITTTTCRKCLSSNIKCEEATSTRRQKRSGDSRIIYLEETIHDLERTIQELREIPLQQFPYPAIRNVAGAASSPAASTLADSTPRWPAVESSERTISMCRRRLSEKMASGHAATGIDELIDSGTLDESKLVELFNLSIKTILSGLCPLQIPVEMTYHEMLRRRPILLQVMCTIASSQEPDLFLQLWQYTKDRLLYEYFSNGNRRLELILAFLLCCEYFQPGDPVSRWIHHAWGPLATEIALDMNLFRTPANRDDAFDDLEHERTVIWLHVVYSNMLTSNRRQPQRVLWTEYHMECKTRLGAGNYRDRQLAKMTSIPRVLVEIQECGLLKSRALVDAFQTRILELEVDFGSSPHPAAQIGISCLILSLHEMHIRSVESMTSDNTQLMISKELCKTAALSVLYTIEQLPGNVLGCPTMFLVRPIQCLIQLCKVFRHLNEDDGFAQKYAERTDQAYLSLQTRGSELAKRLMGKPAITIRWFREAEVIRSDDAAIQVLQWDDEHRELVSDDLQADFDFQAFIDIFQTSN